MRARKVEQAEAGVLERVLVYLSDGAVLVKTRLIGHNWHKWHPGGRWPVDRELPELQRQLRKLGWDIVPRRAA